MKKLLLLLGAVVLSAPAAPAQDRPIDAPGTKAEQVESRPGKGEPTEQTPSGKGEPTRQALATPTQPYAASSSRSSPAPTPTPTDTLFVVAAREQKVTFTTVPGCPGRCRSINL